VAQLLDWDPLRGLQQLEDTDGVGGTGRLQIHYRQDVEPVLDLAKYERVNGIADRVGKQSKQDIYLYARIPPVLILKLKYEHGLDVFSKDKDQLRKAMKVIDELYPAVKCTDKVHRF
jgi:hypothetical protein